MFGTPDLSQFTPEAIAQLFGAGGPMPTTLVGNMYIDAVPWVVAVILGYMGLREYGKARGTSGDVPLPPGARPPSLMETVSSAASGAAGLVGAVKNIFRGQR